MGIARPCIHVVIATHLLRLPRRLLLYEIHLDRPDGRQRAGQTELSPQSACRARAWDRGAFGTPVRRGSAIQNAMRCDAMCNSQHQRKLLALSHIHPAVMHHISYETSSVKTSRTFSAQPSIPYAPVQLAH